MSVFASAAGPSSSRPWSARALVALGFTTVGWSVLTLSCAGSSALGTGPAQPEEATPDAPLVANQPGAWFDAYGNLMVVGAGRRLRLLLSAPIAACSPAFQLEGAPPDVSTRASLPFHILSDACRDEHPTILLAEESETASPSELERSYHEVARCASADWGLTEGWIPEVVAASDPCPLALGLGWRLPRVDELQGLTLDDRKAVAGALFDTEDRAAFGGLLLYARASSGGLQLATLSPNAAEVAPLLADSQRAKPFFGAALRCVRESGAVPNAKVRPPPLAGATECLRAQRQAQGLLHARPATTTLAELQQLKAFIAVAQHNPNSLRSEGAVKELLGLLAAPALDNLAKQAREERALTERYAELAEALDDPAASPAERERRHAEFDHLRRRLGGQIVQSALAVGAERSQLHAMLLHLQGMLETAAAPAKGAKKHKSPDYGPVFLRLRELGRGKAAAP